jgi:hypothetical protein
MKKVIIICLVAIVVLLGLYQIPAVKEVLRQDKAIKEAIAAKLNVPVDSVVVDMDKAERYGDAFDAFVDNLTASDASEMKGASIVKEEKSGKYFVILYEGVGFTVEFAPGSEPVNEEPVAEETAEETNETPATEEAAAEETEAQN